MQNADKELIHTIKHTYKELLRMMQHTYKEHQHTYIWNAAHTLLV